MRIAIVGCGFVADFYAKTIPLQPELELVGVADRHPERAKRFSDFYGVPTYASLDALLADPRVEIVVNLTNPSSHFEVTRACLEAGKHVYSEKPLAMRFEDACELVALAKARGLHLSCAPCAVLNEGAQSVWKALRENQIGKVRLVYGEMDDGLLHRMPYTKWVSASGAPWPYRDEFEVGCTIEHAGYVYTWLAAMFGPARTVTAFSSCLVPDKSNESESIIVSTPDFSVACLTFDGGIAARVTCGVVAPRDHMFKVFGDEGVLTFDDISHDRGTISIRRFHRLRRKLVLSPWSRRYRLVGKSNPRVGKQGAQRRNFARGIAELASAIGEGRCSRLSAEFCLHINELVLATHNALETGRGVRCTTTFEPMEPMPWAR